MHRGMIWIWCFIS